ncbi:hypothetical protein [Spirillospora sp. NPDC029432]|uniref:SCO6745 family protein n=1 Tax=Spirillospora sp. NPDC029432 TaxID=3154599 RepID=UPI00345670AC
MDDSYARTLWSVIEPLHIVTYFSPECVQGHKDVGLKGFWMGYFGGRAAPMGPVPAGVVEATFYGFHPDRVRKAVPDAWTFASPQDILRSRAESAAKALRRLAPGIDEVAGRANPLLAAAVDAADGAGRALFAANRDVPVPDDPVAALWQHAASLREHRGDGHLAVLATEGLDGLRSNLLAAAVNGVAFDMLTLTRGFSAEEIAEGAADLAGRGLLAADGTVTAEGRELRARIEDRTDALAAPAYRVLADPEALHALLEPVARPVMESGEVPFPNPIGLKRR